MQWLDNIRRALTVDADDYDDEPYDDDYTEDDEDDYEEEDYTPRKKSSRKVKSEKASEPEYSGRDNIMSMKQVKKRAQGNQFEVVMMHPSTNSDCQKIIDELLSSKTVVLNLQGIRGGEPQRILDMVSGAVYALGGTLQQITDYICIAAPRNVEFSENNMNMERGHDAKRTFEAEFGEMPRKRVVGGY